MKNFFGNIISIIDTLDCDDEYAYHNYSGEHSASNDKYSDILVNYITNALNIPFKTYCDVGTGNGSLPNKLLKLGYDCYGIDGSDYGLKNDKVVLDIDRLAIFDLTNDISEYIEKDKEFDLTTSFEFLEHIMTSKIDIVINNIKLLSNYHFCSLHTGGKETANHYTVKGVDWWSEKINSLYGKLIILDNVGLNDWEESVFALIEFM